MSGRVQIEVSRRARRESGDAVSLWNVAGVQRACAGRRLPLTGAPGLQTNGNGADALPVLENKLIGRCQRAEEQLARALEREQLLRQKLDAHAHSDQSLHKRLDINLAVLDQKVADMRETLSEKDRAISVSQRIVAQLEQQNGALKQQLEIANQKLDDHAELERQHRLKMKEALEKVKNADKVRSFCWGSVEALRRLAKQIMDFARCWSQG
jgi:chromosome segregation ATPase